MLKPVDTWVVAKRAQKEEKHGSIIVPVYAMEDKKVAEVVAIGPNVSTERKTPIKVGDSIVFGRYAGDEHEISGIKYMLIKEDEIMAVLE